MAQMTIDIPDQQVGPKPGIKSSEHTWLAGLVALIQGQVIAGLMPPILGDKIVAVMIGVYIIARAVVKTAHALGYAKQIADLDDPSDIEATTVKQPVATSAGAPK